MSASNKTLRTRRKRRSAKAVQKHGKSAVPRHRLKAGRTGSQKPAHGQ